MGVMLQGFYWDCPQTENREHQWWTFIKSTTACDRAGRFHCLVASAGEQGSELEIDGLRPVRLLRSRRVRSERRGSDVVRFQSRTTRSYRVCARTGIAGVCRSRIQSQQRRRCTGTESTRRPIALDKVHAEKRQVSPRLEMFSSQPIRDLGRRHVRRHAGSLSSHTVRLHRAYQLCPLVTGRNRIRWIPLRHGQGLRRLDGSFDSGTARTARRHQFQTVRDRRMLGQRAHHRRLARRSERVVGQSCWRI